MANHFDILIHRRPNTDKSKTEHVFESELLATVYEAKKRGFKFNIMLEAPSTITVLQRVPIKHHRRGRSRLTKKKRHPIR